MRLAACASTFQINSSSTSMTRLTNICLASLYAPTVMAACAWSIPINMPKLFFRSLNPRRERNINLKTPIPVYLTYQTAFIDDSGKMQTRPDIYGLDKTIDDLLKRDTRSVDIPIARNYGPVKGHAPSRHVVEQPYSWDRTWDPYSAGSGASSYYRFDRRGSW